MAKRIFDAIIGIMKLPKNLNKYQLFSFLGLFFIGLEVLAILLALTNFFYWPILSGYLFLGGLFFFSILFHNRQALKSASFLSATFLSLGFIIFLSFSFVPTVFSGRDQGSFSEAAVRLAQNHQLSFSSTASQEFFKIYGPGTALNFPGFSYARTGNLITHFSLGYTSWLATFYSLFGLVGFAIANGITFFLFLLAFYFLIELFSSSRSALLALFLVFSSFVFFWLFKFTLSENIALALVWFGILELSLFLKFKNSNYLLLALLSFFILTFTRIEAWAFIAMLAIVLIILQKKAKIIFEKTLPKKIYWLVGAFFLIYLANIFVNNAFYLASIKGLLRSFSPSEGSSVPFSAVSYLFDIFSLYSILPFLIIGTIGLSYFLLKKNYAILVPAFIILPTFIYLTHPGISLDHPWMLRRFAFTIIPGAIFYSILVIDRLFTKKIYFFTLIFILIGTNLLVAWPYFNFKENADLSIETKTLSENFSSTDLVLVDRLASGDGWSMIGAPMNFLFGKNAVYFFNPQDLAKIDTKKFSNVYLIIPNASLAFYQKDNFLNRFSAQKNYALTRAFLATFDPEEVPDAPLSLPQKTENTTNGKIYLLNK